jgi:alkanesulfonate monooxygenase SsuD/methylene tetrahydromethanopterin reductase-like flavin-dependent oxidoreductase (luciferase family)
MELATLAAMHPGRVRAAFGHGVESWMRQIGARPPNRLAALEEVVDTVRALLHGETVSRRGAFTDLDDVRLEHGPASPPPVFVGTTGERGVDIARRAGDGVLLPEGAGPRAVRWASGIVGPSAAMVVYAWVRIGDDGAEARSQLIPSLEEWRQKRQWANLVRLAGLESAADLTEGMVERVAIAGTPHDCARQVRELATAGATSVVVLPTGADRADQLERFSQDVLPLLRVPAR